MVTGPPGSGKTYIIKKFMEIIRVLEIKILLSAPTAKAVDNLKQKCENIIKEMDKVRIRI